MPIILALKCSTADCQSPGVEGEEECHFKDGRGSSQILEYGWGLIDDLQDKAKAAGWHWDGTQWLCPACKPAPLREALLRFADRVEKAWEAETIARSMNV